MLNAESSEIKLFLEVWHENGRAEFERRYTHLDYDSRSYTKNAKTRRKFIACDAGSCGFYLVDRETTQVYSIKAYGVPNRLIGTLKGLTHAYLMATGDSRTLANPGYVDSDRGLSIASIVE